MASQLLASTARLYEGLDEITWEGAAFIGRFLFDDQWLETLDLLENASSLRIRLKGQTVSVDDLRGAPRGHVLDIRVEPPANDTAYFARDLPAFLKIEKFRHQIPTEFYIAAHRYHYPVDHPPADIQKYFRAVEYLGLIQTIADHVDRRATGTWIILLGPDAKTEFPIDYTVEDIGSLGDDLQSLATAVLEPPNAAVKRGLFRNVVVQLLTNIDLNNRCSSLLKSFSEVELNFSHNLELYLRAFSFETEREKFEAQKREYMLKLNNTLHDIHAKLIAIPAAVVLVGGQMKPVDSSAALTTNVVLLAGAVVFAILMIMLTVNQRHSLVAIRREYISRRTRLQSDLPKLYPELAVGFEELEKRYNHQMRLLKWINGLVVLGLVFSIAIFVMYYVTEPPAKEDSRNERLVSSVPIAHLSSAR